jgi:hypothetical protein
MENEERNEYKRAWEEWKKMVSADIKQCTEMRILLRESDKYQDEKIAESMRLIEQLFEHKNEILRQLTTLEACQVDQKDVSLIRKGLIEVKTEEKVTPEAFDKLAEKVTVLMTEKKFLPYLIMILSALTGVGALVVMLVKGG